MSQKHYSFVVLGDMNTEFTLGVHFPNGGDDSLVLPTAWECHGNVEGETWWKIKIPGNHWTTLPVVSTPAQIRVSGDGYTTDITSAARASTVVLEPEMRL